MQTDIYYGVDPECWRNMTTEQRIQAAAHARAVDFEQRIITLERKVAALQAHNVKAASLLQMVIHAVFPSRKT